MLNLSPSALTRNLFIAVILVTFIGKSTCTRVACIGDSITAYACASNATMTYPKQLGRLLGDNYTVLNFGASGRTMLRKGLCGNGARHDAPIPRCGGDCSYWNTSAYEDALQSKPDIVMIMMGTNDAKYCNWYGAPNDNMAFYSDYLDMIRVFRALPTSPLVYVVLPPPLTHPPLNTSWAPPFNMSLHVINEVYPKLQREIAREGANGLLIDVWSALGGSSMDPTLTCDGCHPKDQALSIIALSIASAIDRTTFAARADGEDKPKFATGTQTSLILARQLDITPLSKERKKDPFSILSMRINDDPQPQL